MRQFKTESKKLLDLMINSIYTNKEIFLRELISNASDAVDKLNFKSLQDPSVKLDQGDLAIRVSFDKDARTITISDNGIGMTAEELERNLAPSPIPAPRSLRPRTPSNRLRCRHHRPVWRGLLLCLYGRQPRKGCQPRLWRGHRSRVGV